MITPNGFIHRLKSQDHLTSLQHSLCKLKGYNKTQITSCRSFNRNLGELISGRCKG